ncbi:hypothetical protein N658DRAFT_494562 [Parathielavia hyrcaniae]|uniref:Uncharacterized protein n=1 Tax=Parathielavia hyrcaniae TaxID=113614 RepID=A0AAN6T3U0_9PEZI|nr:hypothetical protein N658DRAFT_494562 [Parathielavia hyrcaniae]
MDNAPPRWRTLGAASGSHRKKKPKKTPTVASRPSTARPARYVALDSSYHRQGG